MRELHTLLRQSQLTSRMHQLQAHTRYGASLLRMYTSSVTQDWPKCITTYPRLDLCCELQATLTSVNVQKKTSYSCHPYEFERLRFSLWINLLQGHWHFVVYVSSRLSEYSVTCYCTCTTVNITRPNCVSEATCYNNDDAKISQRWTSLLPLRDSALHMGNAFHRYSSD